MPYISNQELTSYGGVMGLNFDANLSETNVADNQRRINQNIIGKKNLSPEKQYFCYAYFNMELYKRTGNQAYFYEAKNYFEEITSAPGTPEPTNDFRNQANLCLGDLWIHAHHRGHGPEFTAPDLFDPRHHAVKHYQRVEFKGNNSDDAMMTIKARANIATLYTSLSTFPQNDLEIASPRFFKADHLRCIIAAIETKIIQRKFAYPFIHASDFENFPTSEIIDNFLNPYLSIQELRAGRLVFKGTLDYSQQYKIARACFDRHLIDERNFHTVLRHLHDKIRMERNKSIRQLRRNVKYYLAKSSLNLYYATNDNDPRKQEYLSELARIYDDLMGTHEDLYQEAIYQGKPKALEAQRLMGELIWNGSQQVPITSYTSHLYEITTPMMNFFGTLFYIPLTALGFVVDLAPKLLFFTIAVLLQTVGFIPLLILAFLFQGVVEKLFWPIIAIGGLILAFGKGRDTGLWGQEIKNVWLDTGFTFILGRLGYYFGVSVGAVIGFVLSTALYIPRIIIQALSNLSREPLLNNGQVPVEQIEVALSHEPLALNTGKAPLNYLREDKQYRNYTDPNNPNYGARKYSARFDIFKAPAATSEPGGEKPTAPPMDESWITYDEYERKAPVFAPSNEYDAPPRTNPSW